MPTQNQMDDFSQARFDRAIQDSAYLRQRLQPEPPRRKGADSKRLKRVGDGYIYLRGSDSRRQIASVDADLVLLDEYDQMAEGVLELARKRIASSRAGRLVIASTPRLPEAGINGLFLQSDQRRYYLSCERCRQEQALTWDANVDLERALRVCRRCREPLDVTRPGRWVAEAPGNERIHGCHLSRLYSPWVNIRLMIEASEETTPAALQEFYNSDLGETFVPPGGGLSVDVIDRTRGDYALDDYALDDYAGQPCVMGIDVGLKLHVVIRERPTDETRIAEREGALPEPRRAWFVGELDTFDELDALVGRFRVEVSVIDEQPELRLASAFALRHHDESWYGERRFVWLARYGRREPGHEREHRPGDAPNMYHVNRTEALDASVARFR